MPKLRDMLRPQTSDPRAAIAQAAGERSSGQGEGGARDAAAGRDEMGC